MFINYHIQVNGYIEGLYYDQNVILTIPHLEKKPQNQLKNTLLVENTQIPAKISFLLNTVKKSERKSLLYSEEHDPIVIDGNDDFLAHAVTENWPGDGSYVNPFIIDNYTIYNFYSNFSIEIYNSDVYFQISNCQLLINGREGGIKLSNVGNGNITNNIITNGILGIQLKDFSDSFCSNIIISKNVIQNVTCGINIMGGSTGINVSSNQINNVLNSGIKLQDAGSSEIVNNTIENCGGCGIHNIGDISEGAHHSSIISNMIINNNESGILIKDSDSNTLINNLIIENEEMGIWIDTSRGNLLYNNTIYKQIKSSGLLLWSSENNNISNNFIFNNLGGISLYHSKENVFTKNYVYANDDFSIFLNSSDRNNFSANMITNNHEGIWIKWSDNNLINNNLFWNNFGPGLIIDVNSTNNMVSFNDFTDNSRDQPQAADNSLNPTNIFIYNCWNEWISPDVDSDGIVDNPYPIDDNQDLNPLTGLDLNLPHLVLAPRILSPKENEMLNGTVYINWTLSVDSHKHAVSYNLFYSADNGNNWMEIKSKLIYHYYRLDTTTIPDGTNYLIRVEARCDEGCSSSGVIGTLTIQNKVEGLDFFPIQMILAFLFVVCSIAAGYYLVNTKFRVPSFTEYFQSNKIEFLKPIYHKLIIGLESIQTAIMSEAVATPLLEEPTMPTSLVTWFPDDYRGELKTKLKGRTILTLIEIAFQYSEDANLTKLAQALDIPASTLSDELKKLIKLNYLDFHVTPQVLHDGRYRHYIITAKGISFLKILKSALELSIRRAKEKELFV